MNSINTQIISNWISQTNSNDLQELSNLINKIDSFESILTQVQEYLKKKISKISFIDLDDLSKKISTILYTSSNKNMKGVTSSSILYEVFNLTDNDINRLTMFFQLNNKLNEFYNELKVLLNKLYDSESYNLSSLKNIKNILK